MNISPFLSVARSCDETLQWTNKLLMKAGLRSVQTFDLHVARAGLHDCPCPNHEAEVCDCQMVVLLIYGNANDPVTIMLHGNSSQTWFSITQTPNQKSNAETVTAIKNALGGYLTA